MFKVINTRISIVRRSNWSWDNNSDQKILLPWQICILYLNRFPQLYIFLLIFHLDSSFVDIKVNIAFNLKLWPSLNSYNVSLGQKVDGRQELAQVFKSLHTRVELGESITTSQSQVICCCLWMTIRLIFQDIIQTNQNRDAILLHFDQSQSLLQSYFD